MQKRTIRLHCSLSTYGNAALIDYWHRERGFNKIGYHLVILNGCIKNGVYRAEFDGLLETGRDLDDLGAHTKGFNEELGIVLMGMSNDFTERQDVTLKDTIIQLCHIGPGVKKVKQHSDDSTKKFCAGLSSKKMLEYNNIVKSINSVLDKKVCPGIS